MNMIGWNGKIVPAEQVTVSVMDHGFLYGMTFFETMRTYNGTPFLLERHMERLQTACQSLGIRYTANIAHIQAHIQNMMAACQLQEAYLRYTISAGENGFGLPRHDYLAPQVFLFAKPLVTLSPTVYEQGKTVQLLRARRNEPETSIRFKAGQYMNNIIAQQELLAKNNAATEVEGLMLTTAGYVAEGIVSNIFFVQAGRLYTPDIATGILPGITRQWVIELAQREDITVEVGMYTWEQLLQAEEIFLTSSIQELVPVTTLVNVDGQRFQIGTGDIGCYTQKLLQQYRASTQRIV